MFGLTWGSILTLVSNVFGFFKGLVATFQAESQKQAGRDEVNAETLRRNAERNAEAREVEAEAEKDHRDHPDDDSGFDTSFRRD